MKDGRMGSISFDLKGDQSRTRQIIAGNFKDKDGVIVDFELTADNEGNLFELDIWKVDFSPLISLPNEKEIKITATTKAITARYAPRFIAKPWLIWETDGIRHLSN